MVATTPNVWDELRKAFPKEAVGMLPKPWCKACNESRTRVCSDHKKLKCSGCGNYMTEAHLHLDYVGHAAVTDRLNSVLGPENWTWEPLASDESGMPKLDQKGCLWIRLMVRGTPEADWVVRIGYGDGSTSVKELIGDALRNAAMRFGVALDLWTKEELESTLDQPALKNEKPSASIKTTRSSGNGLASDAQRKEIARVLDLMGYTTLEQQKTKLEGMGEDLPLTSGAAIRVLNRLKGGKA